MSQGMPRVSGSHWKLEEARKGPSLEPSEGMWPCPLLDFWPPSVVCVGFSKTLSVLWQAFHGGEIQALCCCISTLGGLAAVGHEAHRRGREARLDSSGRYLWHARSGACGQCCVQRMSHAVLWDTAASGGVFKGSLQGGGSEGGHQGLGGSELGGAGQGDVAPKGGRTAHSEMGRVFRQEG